MFWMMMGVLVMIYCAAVRVKLGQVRFAVVPVACGVAMMLLGVLILLFPDRIFVWILQFAAVVVITILAAVEVYVAAGAARAYRETGRAQQKKGADSKLAATLVLGCGLKRGSEMPSTLLERLTLARTLWRGEPIVLSGGQTARETCTEASVMKEWMKKNGLSEAVLLEENASGNTRENLLFSRALLIESGIPPEKTRIVTSGFHAARTRSLARACGFGEESEPIVCGSRTRALIAPMYHLRETFAVLYGLMIKRKGGGDNDDGK